MYGLIVKLTTATGKREEMISILKESAGDMPGCLSYVVVTDSADENVIWVTEVWDNAANHAAYLSLPTVRNAMARAKQIISGFDKVAVTNPVWGFGLRSAHVH